jgi:hypothetical protein
MLCQAQKGGMLQLYALGLCCSHPALQLPTFATKAHHERHPAATIVVRAVVSAVCRAVQLKEGQIGCVVRQRWQGQACSSAAVAVTRYVGWAHAQQPPGRRARGWQLGKRPAGSCREAQPGSMSSPLAVLELRATAAGSCSTDARTVLVPLALAFAASCSVWLALPLGRAVPLVFAAAAGASTTTFAAVPAPAKLQVQADAAAVCLVARRRRSWQAWDVPDASPCSQPYCTC